MSRKGITEEPYQVPIWVVTFSDMTTNLLTFFVLLLSMGRMRDETLFDQGRALTYFESVRRGFGLKETLDLANIKIKHHVSDEGDLFEGRTIDAREDDIRRIFAKLSQSIKAMPSPIVAPNTNFLVTDIRFSSGRADLNESAEKFLTGFCRNLQQDTDWKPVDLYVLGLAADAENDKEQWLLSAKHAQAVADFLELALSPSPASRVQHSPFNEPSRWSVRSWGAGPGDNWVGRDSPVSEQSQILIGILRNDR